MTEADDLAEALGERCDGDAHRVVLRTGGLDVEVDGPADLLASGLGELCPPWELLPDKAAPVAFRIVLRRRRSTARLPRGGDLVRTRFDRGRADVERWTTDGTVIVEMPDSGSRIAASAVDRLAFAALNPGRWEEDDIRAVVHRQVVQRLLTTSGGFSLLHAAGICVDGRALLLLGPSGTGKTTAQLDLVSCVRGALLGGGRTYCRRDGLCLAYPGRFPVGRGLAQRRPALRALLDGNHDAAKIAVRSSRLAAVLGTDLAASAQLGVVVFPEVRPDVTAVRCLPLDAAALDRRLRDEVHVPDPRWPNWLAAVPEPDPETSHRIAAEAVAAVPAFALTLPYFDGPPPVEVFGDLATALTRG